MGHCRSSAPKNPPAAGLDGRPYQPTVALNSLNCAEAIHATEPPQQKPVRGKALVGKALLFGPVEGRGNVAHDLNIGRRLDDLLDRLEVLQRGWIPGAMEEGGGDSDIAELGQASANIADIFMHPENLGHHDDDGIAALGIWPRDIGGQGRFRMGEGLFAGDQADTVGDDRLSLRRQGGHGETGKEQTGDPTPGQVKVLWLRAFGAGEGNHGSILRKSRL